MVVRMGQKREVTDARVYMTTFRAAHASTPTPAACHWCSLVVGNQSHAVGNERTTSSLHFDIGASRVLARRRGSQLDAPCNDELAHERARLLLLVVGQARHVNLIDRPAMVLGRVTNGGGVDDRKRLPNHQHFHAPRLRPHADARQSDFDQAIIAINLVVMLMIERKYDARVDVAVLLLAEELLNVMPHRRAAVSLVLDDVLEVSTQVGQ